jgi:HPr kinase/phosphorylase
MINLEDLKGIAKKSIKVGELFHEIKERINLKLLNGEIGFENLIEDKTIHRPSLVLVGYTDLFVFTRLQILGNTEARFLNHLDYKDRLEAAKRLFSFPIPCLLLTNNNMLDEEIINMATKSGITIFRSSFHTANIVTHLADYLDDKFSPHNVIHGSFLDIYGVGILFIGRSGIGKSEISLDLIERGHRLVSDDVVAVIKKGESLLIGQSDQLVKHFMEIRGVGLIDIKNMFGVRAIRFRKRLEVLVELEDWNERSHHNRTGLDYDTVSILGVKIPHIKLSIFPGKNITVISEIIALNYILKHYGYDATQKFSERLGRAIEDRKNKKYKMESDSGYFNMDIE